MNGRPGSPVHFVVPGMIDDAERVSGGNIYDRRVRDGLRATGWDLRMLPVDDGVRGQTARTLAQLPDGALVLIDGLLGAREPGALIEHAARLRLVILAHMVTPDSSDVERAAFRAASAVIATSRWTRAELIAQDAADPHRIVVAHPGTDPAPATTASASGGRLLCVAAVAPHKGQDVLVQALASLTDLVGWTCTIAGSLTVAPEFAGAAVHAAAVAGIAERVTFTGVLGAQALDDAYSRADLVIMPSRNESYGMAVAEALARGIPVLASGAGGISEAIGDGEAAMIVPPGDPWALQLALRHWLTSPASRAALTAAAQAARSAARSWSATTAVIASALTEVMETTGSAPASASGVALAPEAPAGAASRS